ncbi:hypothetical protein [Ornithobacterium rhinotracheale]|uniref:Uncharacterized protein n=2 Tax=Ornithobacterium rhinotracheale TaxID=28251 RepID=I3ZXD6_ORNRL|nr:hypothetical protein [Ornithobacterium rhinotracheale]AFL96370.1 hypothetical protein Ornrh_0146 [Ornithobacterium rhinotracheale DSM 15997]AIQ00252.1 hypothetical protein Q785_00830 [Ornithobacterium rhinotracheale ORT-UMN 88]KGB67781.1 hypothetical protein Q787_00790 [Ornithobacterium rhinotracheale H06-030791]MCK0194699.1 hypothetical protein [Ornithobacterium rhinotracheale]MCK0201065.1 hypothetical protein [Ornithobacterium rhinotracheale]
MKIKYNNTPLIANAIFGLFMIGFVVQSMFYNNELFLLNYLMLAFGVIYFLFFALRIGRDFVIISDDKIMVNRILKKEIAFKDLQEVKYFAGDYIFASAKKKIIIPKKSMKPEQQPEFEKFFNQLLAHNIQSE